MRLFIVFILSTLLFCSAHISRAAYTPSMPQDLDNTDFYLLTIGTGARVDALYGHSLIRIIDRMAGTDMTYNWGTFDFDDPSFLVNFYRGILRYKMGIYGFSTSKRHYIYHHRSMVQEKFFLTKKQKEKFMRKIIWNSQPENVHYMYQFLDDNCSTRIRDYVDEVIGKKIEKEYFNAPSGFTFRDHIRAGMEVVPWAFIGADITLTDYVDKPATKWGEMFLPAKLREYLMKIPAYDDESNPIMGQKLLGETEKILPYEPPPKGTNPYHLVLAIIGIPLIWSAITITPRLGKPSAPLTTRHQIAYRVLGISTLVWALWAGIFGSVMVVNWIFSGHQLLKHSATLWIFWPFDFLYLAPAFLWIKNGGPVNKSSKLFKLVTNLSRAHLVGVGIAIVLHFANLVSQDIGLVLTFFGPLSVLLYWMTARMEMDSE